MAGGSVRLEINADNRDLLVPCFFHDQDASDTCGPAAAMMALDSAGRDCATISQAYLGCRMNLLAKAASRAGEAAKWRTAPEDLAAVATKEAAKVGFSPCFQSKASGMLAALSGSLAAGIPVACAVFEDKGTPSHWGTVIGIRFASPKEGRAELEAVGLWFRSPEQVTPPNGHSDVDDCGRVGVRCTLSYVPIQEWFAFWQTKSYYRGRATSEFVAVVSGAALDVKAKRLKVAKGKGNTILEIAQSAAVAFLDEHWLWGHWGLSGPTDSSFGWGNDFVVAALDSPPRRDYRLLELMASKKRLGFVELELDGGNPQVRALHLHREPQSSAISFENAKTIALRMPASDREADLLESLAQADRARRLVWRPSPWSWLPSLPFFEVGSRDERRIVLLRIDGGRLRESLAAEGRGL